MRFPRQAKIYRGQLEVAPVAAVFFLLVMMLMLAQASTVIPGVRVRLSPPREIALSPERTLLLRKDKKVVFRDGEHNVADLETLFRQENAAGTLPRAFFFDYEPGADRALIERIRLVALETGVRLRPPGTRLELPEHAGYPGTTNATVLLAVNLNGQLFLEHQLIRESQLEERLRALAARKNEPLSMVIQADRDLRYGAVVRLMGVARKAGLEEVIFATRPPIEPE